MRVQAAPQNPINGTLPSKAILVKNTALYTYSKSYSLITLKLLISSGILIGFGKTGPTFSYIYTSYPIA
jgi:hypothetical protein